MSELMSRTDLLSLFIGLYMASASLGLLIDRGSARRLLVAFAENAALGYLGGIMAFVMGAVIISLHNDWSSLRASFVSLVGWAALAEGVLLLAARDWFLGLFSGIDVEATWVKFAALLMIAVGAWLSFDSIFG